MGEKRLNLLIVPYGIETTLDISLCSKDSTLLIVPYGIETADKARDRVSRMTFNRTLWN